MGNVSEQYGRRATRSRSAGLCELNLRGCQRTAINVSHRLPRSGGGGWSPAALLDACGSGTTGCHGIVERDRDRSYELGLLVHRGENPAKVPVKLHHPVYGPAWWQPTDDGLLLWLAPYEQERP